MERIGHKMLLASIRATREEVLHELADLAEDGLAAGNGPDASGSTPSVTERWASIHKTLLRFGDHMREHANQIEATRASLDRVPTGTERTLQEAELAWGKLLASVVNLSDEDCRRLRPDGAWSIEEILQHVLITERRLLEVVRATRRNQAR